MQPILIVYSGFTLSVIGDYYDNLMKKKKTGYTRRRSQYGSGRITDESLTLANAIIGLPRP